MALAILGISYRTAPVALRERFTYLTAEARALLAGLLEEGAAQEAVLLSTCNRTELYLSLDDESPKLEQVLAAFAARADLTPEEARRSLYVLREREAVEHLFRVTAGLDSMVLGEAQINGQVRTALQEAAGEPVVLGPVLRRLFDHAFSVAGRVRSETGLGAGAASIPAAAVELARDVLGSLRGRRALVIGAGEVSTLALHCLVRAGVNAFVTSRVEAKARDLAGKVGARAVPIRELAAMLAQVDVVVSGTSAPHAVLTRAMVERARESIGSHPLVVIDIAVPRDVEEQVGLVDGVRLFNIDGLRQLMDENLERRRTEIDAAEAIVAEGVERFWSWFAALEVAPVIGMLRDRVEELRREELRKALRKLDHLTERDREALDVLTRQLINKVLHTPTVRLRAAATEPASGLVEAALVLFGLDSTLHHTSPEPAPLLEVESAA